MSLLILLRRLKYNGKIWYCIWNVYIATKYLRLAPWSQNKGKYLLKCGSDIAAMFYDTENTDAMIRVGEGILGTKSLTINHKRTALIAFWLDQANIKAFRIICIC